MDQGGIVHLLWGLYFGVGTYNKAYVLSDYRDWIDMSLTRRHFTCLVISTRIEHARFIPCGTKNLRSTKMFAR